MAEKLRQRLYLAAMGIDVWVPRSPVDLVSETPQARIAHSTSESLDLTLGTGPQPSGVCSDGATNVENIAQLGWDALQARVAWCIRCGLHKSRTQTVFGVGNRSATWMIIGEAPGADEDREGEPFVGRAGRLLNAMLQALGLTREEVYIANILKCRPPKNRDPEANEIACCAPYLKRQVELVNPRIILAVGRIAAQSLLKTDLPIGRLRVRPHLYRDILVVATYHPAYLLRSPREKRKAWEDLKLAAQLLAKHSPHEVMNQ
jgi:uracil-DNA glycosylase, family 4